MEPVKSVDVTQELCPMTFVHTKIALEEIEPGQVLEVFLEPGEAASNVPRSIKAQGHTIIHAEMIRNNDGEEIFRLLIKKGVE